MVASKQINKKTFDLPRRNLGVEFLRILAIIWIIIEHHFGVAGAGVPIFFGITGLLIKPEKELIKKQIYKLVFYLILYLPIFIVMRVIIYYSFNKAVGILSPWEWIINMMTPSDSLSNWWYLFAITGALFIHYITIEKYTEKNKWIIFIVLFACFIMNVAMFSVMGVDLMAKLTYHYFNPFMIFLAWNFTAFFIWFKVFYWDKLGAYKYRKILMVIFSLIAVGIILFVQLGAAKYSEVWRFFISGNGWYVSYRWVMALMLVYVFYWSYQDIVQTSFYQINYSLFRPINKAIVVLANSTLVTYLFHSTFIEIFQLPQFSFSNGISFAIVLPVSFMFGVLLTWFGNFCYKKYFNWLYQNKQ